MEYLLHNEMLYSSEAEGIEIYKTYLDDADRYGLFWKSPNGHQWSHYKYVLIHQFESKRAAALRFEGDQQVWCWIDVELNETLMDELDFLIYEALRVSDSICYCVDTEDFLACNLCSNKGLIENSYNFKKELVDSNGNILYTYYTKKAFYTIYCEISSFTQSLLIDYAWKKDEVIQQIKDIIVSHEVTVSELKECYTVCVFESNNDTTIKLISYDIHITKIPLRI